MSLSSINATTSSDTSAASNPQQLGNQEFLQLLVTQLQNQDPLNPMDNQQFIAQMAQLSTLEATNSLASQVGQMAAGQQQMAAFQLVGHNVQFTDSSGASGQGKVSGVKLDGASPTLLIDGTKEVPLDQVQTVL